MTRIGVLAALGLTLVAGGCFGGSASPPSVATHELSSGTHPQPYARFHVRGVYGPDLRRARFTLSCRRPVAYRALYGLLTWRQSLCLAILDYREQTPLQGGECNCPASPVLIDVRGTIRGRAARERIIPCLCGDGPEAAHDARLILRLHPPLRASG